MKYISIQLLIISFIILLSGVSYSQVGYHEITTEEALEVKSTKLMVVLTGLTEFDKEIKSGFEKYWEHTEYEFVENFQSDISNEDYSFFIPLDLSFELINPAPRHRGNEYSYPIYALIKGGKDKLSDYNDQDLIAYTMFSSKGKEVKIEDATYRAAHMVRMLNDYLTLKVNDKINVSGSRYRFKTCDLFSEDSKDIINYKLLVDKSSLDDFDPSYLDKKYPGKITYASTKEYRKIVSNRNEDYCYLLPIHGTHSFLYVVHAKTGKILFATYGLRGMRKKEAKTLIKAVK